MQVVKELEIVEIPDAIHPRRRMVLIQREDGFYAYAEQYYYISRYGARSLPKAGPGFQLTAASMKIRRLPRPRHDGNFPGGMA